MHNIQTNALRVDQLSGRNSGSDDKQIFITNIKVSDLIDEYQFKVDFWDPREKDSDKQGYQRVPAPSHFHKIGKYVEDEGSILPGAILISARKGENQVAFTPRGAGNDGSLSMEKPPFWIIDGQHRVAGLRYAINELGVKQWLDKEIPVVLLANFTKLEEIAQFKTMNSTAKKVDTGLAQQLLLLRAQKDDKFRKSLKLQGEDWKIRALKLLEMLNENEDSPWYSRIILPNSNKVGGAIMRQNSFITSLKPLYVGGAFEFTRNLDNEYEIVRNYWLALKKKFPASFVMPAESVIMKTPGVFSLHALLRAILQRKGMEKEAISVEGFCRTIDKVFEGETGDDYFWSTDNTTGAALYGSMRGFRILSDQFISNMEESLS
jgi:DGQHR domain-containing protein